MKYRIGNYLDLAYLIPMLRRYLVLGTFDGLLTSISVIVASFLSNASPHQTISVTLSALIGISAASAANAFVVELQEYKKEISRLERQLMKSLKGTFYVRSMEISIALLTLVHAMSPFSGLILMVSYLVIRGITGLILSVAISLILLFFMGLIYGTEFVSGAKAGFYMAVSGSVAIFLVAFVLR